MKIFFFDFTINFGGAPQGSLYLMSRLKKSGYDVGIVDVYGQSLEYQKKVSEYNLNYYLLKPNTRNTSIGFNDKPLLRFLSITKQSKDFLFILINLYKVIKTKKPDVFIVNNEKSLFFINLLKSLFKFKIICYYRGEGTSDQLSKNFKKTLINRTDHVVTHSKKALENLKKEKIPLDKLTYIPNCIEDDKVKKPVYSTDLPTKTKFRLILASARHIKEKGHHTAIKAIYELKKKNIDVDLLIPGVIPTGVSNTYYHYLKKLINEYELNEDVHFIGWRSNLIADIIQCDTLILPSYTEGFPRSIIESMLHRVPVCATPVGGIPEAIKHKETGMLFDVESVQQLVECLSELVSNSKLKLKIIDNAEKFSHYYFDPQKNTLGMISVLNKIISIK